MQFFFGWSSAMAGVLLGSAMDFYMEKDDRRFNLLATSWNMSPPEVEVLGFDLSGDDCISLMHTTFVGPEKILSCEFDEGEWDE